MLVNSNGTSFGYVPTLNAENGPVSLDLFSIPKYKVDQSNNIEGKMKFHIRHKEMWFYIVQLDEIMHNDYCIQ